MNETGTVNDSKRLYGIVFLAFALIVGMLLLQPVPSYTFVSPQQQPTPTCTQPDDVDIAFAFCDATHDDIADEYSSPLYDVSTDIYIPPIVLKAIGGAETQWLQCSGGDPVTNGCDWGLMQIGSGMNCVDPTDQFNSETQLQVKYDYRYNIGMGAKVLKWKWAARAAGNAIIGDGSPQIAEHWYYAVWSYGTGGWSFSSCPNNPVFDSCNWPNVVDLDDCAYVDRVWWWARNPHSRNGHALWSPVNLTRPNQSLFPRTGGQWASWNWITSDPTPVHRDSCRTCLPLVLKDYPPCAKPVQDGGFEDWGWNYWARSGTTHSTLAYSGSCSARLGGDNGINDILYQTVTIPNVGPEGDPVVSVRLIYYWHMTTDETSTTYDYDHFYARIRNMGGGTLRELEHLTNQSAEGTWVSSSFDVTEFKGQTVQVYFKATTDSSLPTSFYVDDIAIYACESD